MHRSMIQEAKRTRLVQTSSLVLYICVPCMGPNFSWLQLGCVGVVDGVRVVDEVSAADDPSLPLVSVLFISERHLYALKGFTESSMVCCVLPPTMSAPTPASSLQSPSTNMLQWEGTTGTYKHGSY